MEFSFLKKFGTIPGVFVALALIRENQAYHYSTDIQEKAYFGKTVYVIIVLF